MLTSDNDDDDGLDDFKPASIDTTQPAVIDIEQGNKVKVTVPHVEVGFLLSFTFIRSVAASCTDLCFELRQLLWQFEVQ